MNLCKRGHDKDTEGTNREGYCRACKREDGRKAEARRRKNRTPKIKEFPHVHTEHCEWVDNKYKSGRFCLTRRTWYDAIRRGARTIEDMTDGLEDLYGPVPPPIPEKDLLDEVIVLRVLEGQESPRKPTPLETKSILQKNPFNKNFSLDELGRLTGMSRHGLLWHQEARADA